MIIKWGRGLQSADHAEQIQRIIKIFAQAWKKEIQR